MTKVKLTVILLLTALILPVATALLPEAPDHDAGMLDIRSEWSTMMEAPQGHPDKFLAYYHTIRASENGEVDYPVGYRHTAIEQAKAIAKSSPQRLGWVERGPAGIGGRTRGLWVDPIDPDRYTWWAGSVGGGLWKTTDAGVSWEEQTRDFPIMSISTLAASDGHPNVMYMGTGEGFGNLDAIIGNGIFRSANGGATWEHLASTIENAHFRAVNRLAVDPMDPDVVVAATNHGLLRSTDGGMTWAHVYPTNRSVQDLRAQPGNFARLIASVNAGEILYSSDAGASWQAASTAWVDAHDRTELAYSRSHPNIAYAATESGSTAAHLYYSTDGGIRWSPTKDNDSVNWMESQGWYNNTLAVHPYDPSIVYVGGIELWKNTILTGEISDLDTSQVQSWMALVNFGGSAHGGTVDYLPVGAMNISQMDYTNVEIRFGQGSQKAHRFTVSVYGGTSGNGGPGILFNEYQYADYVDVPFTVWDTDKNRQLMVSFRDQADNGAFDLIEFFTSAEAGTRDLQSREYLFIHKYDYDGANPHDRIDADGGLVHGMLYMLWPVLESGATWDPENMSPATITLGYELYDAARRTISSTAIDPNSRVHVDHHNLIPIVMDDAQERFWLLNANDGGVAVSTDNGVYFRELDHPYAGYNTSQFYDVSKKPEASEYLGGTQDNGTWRSWDNPTRQSTWTSEIGGDGMDNIWHSSDPDKAMASTQYSYILRSTDGGRYWSPAGDMLFDYFNGLFLSSLSSSDTAPDYVYTLKRQGVYVSDNFGESWNLVPISHAWGFWDGGKVRVSLADHNVVWAGYGMDPNPYRRLHLSKDQGESFAPVALPAVTRNPETVISGLATHPTEAGTAYALFARHGHAKVLETKDFGDTWTDLSAYNAQGVSENGFPELPAKDLVVMPHAPHIIWAGTDAGIFRSRNSGSQWEYADNGLPAVSIWRMKIRDNELLVATHGRGIWTLPLSEVTDAEENITELPSGFELRQNYPNPFNASATIGFSVPDEAPVRLTIFDASGRRVTVLTDRVYAPGMHEVRWTAHNQVSGLYFYRLETGGRIVHTRKMTLLK